jgi:hypothetical protein
MTTPDPSKGPTPHSKSPAEGSSYEARGGSRAKARFRVTSYEAQDQPKSKFVAFDVRSGTVQSRDEIAELLLRGRKLEFCAPVDEDEGSSEERKVARKHAFRKGVLSSFNLMPKVGKPGIVAIEIKLPKSRPADEWLSEDLVESREAGHTWTYKRKLRARNDGQDTAYAATDSELEPDPRDAILSKDDPDAGIVDDADTLNKPVNKFKYWSS